MRLAIDRGDRRVSEEGQHRWPTIIFVGGQPGPQVAGRQNRSHGQRALLFDADR